MKRYILTLSLIVCATLTVFGQRNNKKLYEAIIKNDTEKVAKLLDNKADPNGIVSSGPWMKVNMLITAVNNDNIVIAKLLLAKNADVNWKDGFNTTALMYAASKGNKGMAILLLDNGADINSSDGQGNTVLTAAKESHNQEIIAFIEDKLKAQK